MFLLWHWLTYKYNCCFVEQCIFTCGKQDDKKKVIFCGLNALDILIWQIKSALKLIKTCDTVYSGFYWFKQILMSFV